jgi:hypothetical protein
MQRNSWGMKPAGSICSIAMLRLAERYRDQYPDVYHFITEQMYVDDGVHSVDSVDSAVKLAREIHYVLAQGNFRVKHFIIGGKSVDVTTDDLDWSDTPETVRFGEDTE